MVQGATSNLVVIDLISDNEALKFEVAGRLAEAIIELRRKDGGCMPQDLNERGFTPSEVAENWDAAHFLIAINDLIEWGKNGGKSET
ncbi:MAG: hypothetical protein PHW76_03425 [Alphaproteobacteria bacterium]|nr:hypothetical protein [Alphaproteobacteria bacterium]